MSVRGQRRSPVRKVAAPALTQGPPGSANDTHSGHEVSRRRQHSHLPAVERGLLLRTDQERSATAAHHRPSRGGRPLESCLRQVHADPRHRLGFLMDGARRFAADAGCLACALGARPGLGFLPARPCGQGPVSTKARRDPQRGLASQGNRLGLAPACRRKATSRHYVVSRHKRRQRPSHRPRCCDTRQACVTAGTCVARVVRYALRTCTSVEEPEVMSRVLIVEDSPTQAMSLGCGSAEGTHRRG